MVLPAHYEAKPSPGGVVKKRFSILKDRIAFYQVPENRLYVFFSIAFLEERFVLSQKQMRKSTVINIRKKEAPQGALRAEVKYKKAMGATPPRRDFPSASLIATPVYLTWVGKRSKANLGMAP